MSLKKKVLPISSNGSFGKAVLTLWETFPPLNAGSVCQFSPKGRCLFPTSQFCWPYLWSRMVFSCAPLNPGISFGFSSAIKHVISYSLESSVCVHSQKVCFCLLSRSLTLPYVNIGLIMLLHLDRYFEAIEQFTTAIRVDPLDTRSYLCRAQAYHKVFPKITDSNNQCNFLHYI